MGAILQDRQPRRAYRRADERDRELRDHGLGRDDLRRPGPPLRGTFVLRHGGVGDHAFGHTVPGSGTGELAGLSGEAVYAHDDAGARLTLSYALAARS
jgi:hypothetical protein